MSRGQRRSQGHSQRGSHVPQVPLRGRASAAPRASLDSAQVAEDIGLAALELAQRASAAGLTTLCFLLEAIALEAGAAAAAARWPGEEPR